MGEPVKKPVMAQASTLRQPDWDIDQERGTQSELWVKNCRSLLLNGEIEVKSNEPFLKWYRGGFYVESWCLHSDRKWHKSGINKTKSKGWVATFGKLPGGLMIETAWLKRAALLAFSKGQLKECNRGSHPTKGVLVTFEDLWETREGEP